MDSENATWRKEMVWDDHRKWADSGTGKYCDVSPHIMLNSHGILENIAAGSDGMALWEYPLPQLEIIIFSVFVFWRFFDILFKKLRIPIPKFTSMMLAGAVLGVAFESMHMSWFHHIFTHDDKFMPKVAETVGAFAFVLDWFLRGVNTDVGRIKKSGTKCIVIGVISMIIPWQIGRALHSSREKSSIPIMTAKEYTIITLTMSMTPFTCVNMFLTDLKIVHTEFGQIAQSSGMVTDALAFCINVWSKISRDYYNGLRMGTAFIFFFLFLYLVRQAMLWIIRHTPEGAEVKNIYLYFGLLLAYLSYLFWSHFLFFGPLGAFVLGLTIPNGPPLGSVFIKRFRSFNEGIFLPLFGSLSMIKLDWGFLLKEFGDKHHLEGHIYECLSFLLTVHIAKFVTAFVAAIAVKMPLRDSINFGTIMCTKSSFELVYVLQSYEKNRISVEVFTLIGIYILINSFATPMAIHFLYNRTKKFVCYRKRNLKDKSELQTLVCIKQPDDITSMISLLRASSPSKESPMECCVLHLIELMGQASTPTFISHQLQKPKPGTRSYSANVISSFQLFQDSSYWNSTSINMFTSLTSYKEMPESVCWFAFDINSNLILLSFHRIWGPNGIGIISDDQTLRIVNRNILKRAPCSVGIFVYRKPIWPIKSIESECRVCLIYVGGKDDKEAFALADHMRRNKEVNLTVLHLIPASHADEINEWSHNQMLDMPQDKSINYIDKMAADGTETSKILQSIAYDYDLFIVGRSCGIGTRVIRGLGDWMEFDELGVIGDFLSSEYFPSKASVFVIQQQD